MRYSQITIFNMAVVRHFEFANFDTLSCDRKQNLRRHTKFHWNRLISGWDIAIKPFSKWQMSAIFNFWNLVFRSLDMCLSVLLLLRTKFRVNRTINRWNIAKHDFQYGGGPPSWICCDVIVLHPGTLYYVPNIVLNFHLGWFSSILDLSCFSILDGNWVEVIMGQISVFYILTPKGTSLCDSASFEPLRVKIWPGVSFLRCCERKIVTKSYISPLCPEVPRERIFTKFGTTNVHLVDIINPDKLCVNLFKDFDFTGGQSFHFSHRKLTSPL